MLIQSLPMGVQRLNWPEGDGNMPTSSSDAQPISKYKTDEPNFAPADISNLSIVRASTTTDGLDRIDSLSIKAVDLAMESINCEGLRPS